MTDTDLEEPNSAIDPAAMDPGASGGNAYEELLAQATAGSAQTAPSADEPDEPLDEPEPAVNKPAEAAIGLLVEAAELRHTPENAHDPEELRRLDKIRKALKQNLHDHHKLYVQAGWVLAIAAAGELLGAPTIVSLFAEAAKMALAVWLEHHEQIKHKAAHP